LARVPLAVAFALVAHDTRWALVVLALAGLSDLLDGWLARKLDQCTATGALVDGATDKLFVLAVAGSLWRAGNLSLEDVLLLGVRDVGELIVTLWIASSHDDHALHEEQRANALGKLTTALQFSAVILAILRVEHFALCLGAAVVGALAAISYARRAKAS
jgi:phosphatidylglycerophosphate synthase